MYYHKGGIKVRKCEQSDLSDLLWLKQEGSWGTHTFPLLNQDDQQQWFKAAQDLCLVLELNALPVGVCILSEIDWISRSASISGSVYKDHRKDEIIKKCCAAGVDFAFEVLNLQRLEAEVLDYNFPAQKFEIGYLRFKVEGRRRRAVYKFGHYWDSLVLGLLRHEWSSHNRVRSYGGSCNTTFDYSVCKNLITRSNRFLNELDW